MKVHTSTQYISSPSPPSSSSSSIAYNTIGGLFGSRNDLFYYITPAGVGKIFLIFILLPFALLLTYLAQLTRSLVPQMHIEPGSTKRTGIKWSHQHHSRSQGLGNPVIAFALSALPTGESTPSFLFVHTRNPKMARKIAVQFQ